MAVKKINIISSALLFALVTFSVSTTFANNANNLVQMDLKKSSNNSVDVTLFTSNNYNDNVLVRKKSDNKYVILIPKVQSSGFSSSSLSSVKDLVSNIDVKTVNDTSGGYTKVTLITTRPLDIKTRTQTSSPVSAEQKEYNTLIAQANAVKNTIAAPPKTTAVVQKPKKTEITVTQNTRPEKEQVKNIKQVKQEIKPQTKKAAKAPEIKLTEVQTQKIEKPVKKEILKELISEAKKEKTIQEPPKTGLTPVPPVSVEPLQVKDIQEMPVLKQENKLISAIKKLKGTNIPKNAGIVIAVLAGLITLSNIIKALTQKSKEIKEAYINHLANTPPVVNTVKYNNIVNNKELSWQEKYQSYLSETAKPVSRGENKGTYTFIKKPAEPDEITKKRYELEKMLKDIPDVENNNIQPAQVQNEDEIIQKTNKFKAFDNHKLSLDTADRLKTKSRFKKYEIEIPLQEQKNIALGDSMMHSNPRRLKDATLDIRDVDKKRLRFQPSDYIMSSVDEFFSILDKEQTQAPQKVIKPEAAPLIKKVSEKQTNPITKLKNETKKSYLNGLILKSGFNIDENRGFYMVNLEGKSALVGKVNEEIFVLKKFDTNITNPIQVRHDNANVYMVKAGGFKSLVEVNDDKMGVLIEL